MTPFSAHSWPHHVVSHAQLAATGVSAGSIRHAIASQRLFAKHRGVYSVGRPELTREGRWLAAVLACADGAVLSHRSAAVLQRLLDFEDGRTHVLVPYGRSNGGPGGVRLHRTRRQIEWEFVDHIPVTTVPRTLQDLARAEADAPLKGAVLRALKLGHEVPRTGRLRGILDLLDPLAALTDSELERRFLALCRRHRIPLPELRQEFGNYRADFTWHSHRLIVETDGGVHRTPEQHRHDVARDRYLASLGYEVLRFARAEVVHTPAAVADELRSALMRRERTRPACAT